MQTSHCSHLGAERSRCRASFPVLTVLFLLDIVTISVWCGCRSTYFIRNRGGEELRWLTLMQSKYEAGGTQSHVGGKGGGLSEAPAQAGRPLRWSQCCPAWERRRFASCRPQGLTRRSPPCLGLAPDPPNCAHRVAPGVLLCWGVLPHITHASEPHRILTETPPLHQDVAKGGLRFTFSFATLRRLVMGLQCLLFKNCFPHFSDE